MRSRRIGVFICHCGKNIASVVDVEHVAEVAAQQPDVVFATHTMYTCADSNLNNIRDMIHEHRLNRIVVASCTPRTHEPIFRDTLREAGLNPYLFELANIRDQCSWVHSAEPEKATRKGHRTDEDVHGTLPPAFTSASAPPLPSTRPAWSSGAASAA